MCSLRKSSRQHLVKVCDVPADPLYWVETPLVVLGLCGVVSFLFFHLSRSVLSVMVRSKSSLIASKHGV